MYCPLKTLVALGLSLFVLIVAEEDEMSRKRSFCGRSLTKMLATMCQTYPSPEDDDSKIRVKRQVTRECCYSPCSLEYLLNSYCETINKTALEEYKLANQASENQSSDTSEELTTISSFVRSRRLSRRYRQRNANGGSVEETTIDELDGVSRKVRGKRNCTCKKHRKIKQAKRRQQYLEMLSKSGRPVPEARLGERDEGQVPFHVLERHRHQV